jgi:hypothetical protein
MRLTNYVIAQGARRGGQGPLGPRWRGRWALGGPWGQGFSRSPEAPKPLEPTGFPPCTSLLLAATKTPFHHIGPSSGSVVFFAPLRFVLRSLRVALRLVSVVPPCMSVYLFISY